MIHGQKNILVKCLIFFADFLKFRFSPQIFVVAPNIKYHRNRSTGSGAGKSGQTDRQTKFMTKEVGSFSEHA